MEQTLPQSVAKVLLVPISAADIQVGQGLDQGDATERVVVGDGDFGAVDLEE